MKGVLFDAEDVLYYRDAETLKPIISLLSKHSYSVSGICLAKTEILHEHSSEFCLQILSRHLPCCNQ